MAQTLTPPRKAYTPCGPAMLTHVSPDQAATAGAGFPYQLVPGTVTKKPSPSQIRRSVPDRKLPRGNSPLILSSVMPRLGTRFDGKQPVIESLGGGYGWTRTTDPSIMSGFRPFRHRRQHSLLAVIFNSINNLRRQQIPPAHIQTRMSVTDCDKSKIGPVIPYSGIHPSRKSVMSNPDSLIMTVEDVAAALGKAPRSILQDLRRNPDAVPPARRPLGARRPFWIRSEFEQWALDQPPALPLKKRSSRPGGKSRGKFTSDWGPWLGTLDKSETK